MKWRATGGYTINTDNGVAEKRGKHACTLHFFYADQGDVLHLLDDNYEYAVATYGLNIDSRYIYTYDYQPEESWTTYCHDFSGMDFRQKDYVFSEGTYFRIVLRTTSNLEETGGEADLDKILQWRPIGIEPQGGADKASGTEMAYTVQSVMERHRDENLNFLLMTDSHYTVNGTWEDTTRNLYQLSGILKEKGIGLNGFIHLGDATDGLVQAEVTRDYVTAMQRDIQGLGLPLYYVIGNHDSNYFRKNPERFSEEEIRALYLPEREKLYYYQDFSCQRLRMIFLDSFNPKETVRYGFHEEELEWLENILRQTLPGWYVLVFSHVPPTPRLHYWSKEIRGSGRLIRILRDFQNRIEVDASGGKLLGFIHGHNHADQIDYEEGFPIISIGCNKCEYFEDKKPEGAVAYKRTLGTASQDLWDVLIVSTENETLDFIRFGAGEDRHVSLANREERKQRMRNGSREREKPMKKVITYGTFDLFHEGHYNILKRAKALGDYLIAGITTEHYDEQRGKINIVDSLLERIENVRRTGLVDEIIIEDHEGQKIEDVQKYDVDIFALGSDWKGTFDYLKAYCQVVYLERTPDISSTMLRKGKFPIIRLGIVGTGRIAPRFISEAKYVSGLNVQSVYNPHKESADEFAATYSLDSHSDDFNGFLDAVDAIYIASPHETHYDYTRRALSAGKHVLCEKPMAFTRRQTEELFSLAKERQLVLMEGIKTAYCPGFAQLISVAKSGKIGEIRDVEACFSRLTAPNLREMVDVQYGGAFLEFGSYTILPIVKLMGTKYDKIKISSILAENGVDLYTKIYFDYPNGMATSKTGLGVKSEGQLLISGTQGYILAESPWWLTRKFQVRYEDPAQIETYSFFQAGDGIRYEIGEFALRINGRGGHLFKLTEEETFAMADVVERFMEKRAGQGELM